MAKLRKFVAYRRLDGRPYTRKSKYRAKSFVRASPNNRIVRYIMGDPKTKFQYHLTLTADAQLQIRDNALEAGRQFMLRHLERNIGKGQGFCFRLRVFPHHILRENPLASGAGADRMSTGMKMSFGKAIGVAARLKKGQAIYSIDTDEKHLALAKGLLQKAATKLPCSCRVLIEKNQ